MANNDKMEEQVSGRPVSADQGAQQRKIRFIEEGVKTGYANVFNIGFGTEEVMFIFGNQALEPNVVRIESKTAVSMKNAKRIAVALNNLLRRYEAILGVLDISTPAAQENKPGIQ